MPFARTGMDAQRRYRDSSSHGRLPIEAAAKMLDHRTMPTDETLTFVGTVQSVTSTAPSDGVQAVRSAVVRVDQVLLAPDVLGDLTGSAMTVLVGTHDRLDAGCAYRFGVAGSSYGERIVTRLVSLSAAGVRGKLPAPSQAAQRTRFEAADMVVAGTLETVGPVTQSLRRTEHDLASSIATLKVETLLKSIEARSQPETIEVELPMSTDVLWQRTHEPTAGCRAVFFLRDSYGADHADGHQFADPPRAQRFFVDDVASIDELDDLHAIAVESTDQ